MSQGRKDRNEQVLVGDVRYWGGEGTGDNMEALRGVLWHHGIEHCGQDSW